jgi:hypothetical protein
MGLLLTQSVKKISIIEEDEPIVEEKITSQKSSNGKFIHLPHHHIFLSYVI